MVDNFKIIKNLLKFESEDDFYFVQIYQRKKDNPDNYLGSNNSSRVIKLYYIKSIEELEKKKEEIIKISELFNARVGINLNKRSFYKTSFNSMKILAEKMHNKSFNSVHKTWSTACGIHNGGDKFWLLDVDEKEIDLEMLSFIDLHCPPYPGVVHSDGQLEIDSFKFRTKIIAKIPSKFGWSVITKAFDSREFVKKYPEIAIHKNNPVNLYIPDGKDMDN